MNPSPFRFLSMLALVAIQLAAAPGIVSARFAQPSLLPVEQLLSTVETHLKDHPGDAQAHYTAGRIHYLAFFNLSDSVSTYPTRGLLPSVEAYWTAEQSFLRSARRAEATKRALLILNAKDVSSIPQDQRQDFFQQVSLAAADLEKNEWKPQTISYTEAITHAEKAFTSFNKALKLDARNALYHLGRASLLEQFATFAKSIKAEAIPESLSGITQQRIRNAYAEAWTAGLAEADKLEEKPVSGLRSVVSYEAGQAFLRLCEEESALSEIDKERVKNVKASIAKLDKLRRGAITPVVFSTNPDATFIDLLQPNASVPFDLDGDGTIEHWPWVQPDTGFLVWDPGRKGTIASGRQLFGSYTFQIPWNHGYEPLAMLDISGDGELSNAELNGIRVWFDRNSNGRSEPREVVDLSELDIEAIGLDIEHLENGPTCERGLRLTNGTELPTWDWIAKPHIRGEE